MSLPSLGRIVHLTLRDGDECPAIITRVNADGTINACAFNDEFQKNNGHVRTQFWARVPQDETAKLEISWHWPQITHEEIDAVIAEPAFDATAEHPAHPSAGALAGEPAVGIAGTAGDPLSSADAMNGAIAGSGARVDAALTAEDQAARAFNEPAAASEVQ